MNIHRRNILLGLMMTSFFLFDYSTVLFISTLYMGMKHKQTSMFMKAWFLFVYIMYGITGLLTQLISCGILFFIIYRQKCIEKFSVINTFLDLSGKYNMLVVSVKELFDSVSRQVDSKFGVDNKLDYLDQKLGDIYRRVYNIINSFSPMCGQKLKYWFDNLSDMVKDEDNYLEVKPVTQEVSGIEKVLSYLRRSNPESKDVSQINKLLEEINGMTEVISKIDS